MADFFDALKLGTRVVVRYRIDDGAGHTLSDALGVFDGVVLGDAAGPTSGERAVRILTRRGPVLVPTAQITHAKPVPPPPDRRRSHASH